MSALFNKVIIIATQLEGVISGGFFSNIDTFWNLYSFDIFLLVGIIIYVIILSLFVVSAYNPSMAYFIISFDFI